MIIILKNQEVYCNITEISQTITADSKKFKIRAKANRKTPNDSNAKEVEKAVPLK